MVTRGSRKVYDDGRKKARKSKRTLKRMENESEGKKNKFKAYL